jgi:hypothetical protein
VRMNMIGRVLVKMLARVQFFEARSWWNKLYSKKLLNQI